MRIKIDGRELRVVRTTNTMIELQQRTGMTLEDIDKLDKQGGGQVLAAWFALRNAGHEPDLKELMDWDLDRIVMVKEPADEPAEEAVPDPQTSPEDSDRGAGGEPAATTA